MAPTRLVRTIKESTKQAVALATTAVVFFVLYIFVFKNRDDAFTFAIVSGILASLVASFVYQLVDKLLFPAKFTPEDVLNKLDELSVQIQEIRRVGILYISTRSGFDDPFWLREIEAVQRSASKNTELMLIGRSLEKWTSEAFSTSFATAIIAVLNKGGRVKFITLHPQGNAAESHRRLASRDITNRVGAFDKFVETKILARVKKDYRVRLERRYVNDIQLTFTMFRSDSLAWMSPYLSFSDTSTNVALALDPKSTLASTLVDDFRNLWEAAQDGSPQQQS